MSHPVLTALGLTAVESGTYLGNGEWSQTRDAGVLEPVNPTTGEVLGRVHASSQADYDLIVARAQAAFKVWRTTPAPRRGEAIRLCADALRVHKDALGSLVALEMGKSKPEGDGEVQEMIDIGEFAVGLSRQLYGLTMHSERPGHRMYEQWHPLGLVGIISAFNFPVAVWAWNSFIAAVCGDISIWKPSPKTPLSAIAAMKICNEALRKGGFPDIFFLFNDAGSDIAQGFVDDRRIALISFTGSTKVGRMVGERVARRMGRSLLELGGNNAIIVDETADLALAIPAIVFGAVGTAGQRCTTTRRLIVHASIYADVLARLVAAYKQVEKKIGDPTDPANLMGPLNSQDGVDAYLDAIAKAKAAGGTVETGGAAIDRPGNFVLPTIITGLSNDAEIVQALRFHARGYMHGHTVGGTNPSLVEALWAGNPVIAHDNPYNRWTAGAAGLFFNDDSSCEAAIENLLGDDALAARLKAAALARAQKAFTWQTVLEAYEREALALMDRVPRPAMQPTGVVSNKPR